MSDVQAIEARRPREAIRGEVGASRLHARGAGRVGDSARRAERCRQDDVAAARGRAERAELRRGASARPLAATGFLGAAAAARIRRAGAPALPRPHGRPRRSSSDASSTRAGTRRSRRSGSTSSGSRSRQKVGKLSGGQQAQVALTLALAKRPELLVLDEPVASLDPLARREFLQTMMEAVVDTGMTVVLSSHIVADLERVCDHLIILSQAETQLVGPIDEVVASHRLLTGPRGDPAAVARVHEVIRESHTERQTTLLVRANGHVYDSCWEVARGRPRGDRPRLPRPSPPHCRCRHGARRAGGRGMTWVSWRLQRTETLIAVGILALIAALLVPTGITMALRLPPRRPRRLPRHQPLRQLQPGDRGIPAALPTALRPPRLVHADPGPDRCPARGAVHPRARERHLPARLDAEHHPPSLDRDQARRSDRGRAAHRRCADPAHDLVASAVRPPQRTHGNRHLRLRGHRRLRLHPLRARLSRSPSASSGAEQSPPSPSRSSATSPPGSSSTPGCEPASSLQSRPRGTPPPGNRRTSTTPTSSARRGAVRASSSGMGPVRSEPTSTLPSASGPPPCTPSTSRRATSGRSRDSRPRSSAAWRSS